MAIKIIRIVALVLVIALLGVVSFNLLTYTNDNDDLAIIVVHGMGGGGLVDKNGEPVWDPLGGDLYYKDFFTNPVNLIFDILFGQEYNAKTSKILNSVIQNDPNNLIYQLTSDEDGNIKNNGIVAATMDSPLPFGPLKAYKDIYDGINNEFGKDIEVVMFQYDFRQDNKISAKQLENYINKNGWKKVIICAHSMGNIVTSDYLSLSQENRDKVKGFMAMAGPFYGATNALVVLENPNHYIGGVYDLLDKSPFLKDLIGNKVDKIIEKQVLPFIFNMASVAQLLPTIEYSNLLKEFYGDEFININGKEITTNEELQDFYLSRPWAKKTNGNIKAYMQNLSSYFDSHFVEQDGKKVHVTELINTFYFAGTGLNTAVGVKYKNNVHNLTYELLGDGTVPLYSATLGKNPKEFPNVKIYEEQSHLDIGMLYEGQFAQDLSAAIRYLL